LEAKIDNELQRRLIKYAAKDGEEADGEK